MFSGMRNRFASMTEEEDPFREDAANRGKSRRPPNTAFRQQRLKSWQPILTPRTVLPLLLLLAIVCIPLGIAFLIATLRVQRLEVNYTDCATRAADGETEISRKHYHAQFHTAYNTSDVPRWSYQDGVCTVQVSIPNDMRGPIYLYYRLTNFYQNHRRYVQSYDWDQLRGKAVAREHLSRDCGSLRTRDDHIVYPCGLIANSMFNDTFSNLVSVEGDADSDYRFSAHGIAWPSDHTLYKRTKYAAGDIVPPENWAHQYPSGYSEADLDSLAADERFMNWMRTAAFPSFYKLYGINRHDRLHAGTYEISIDMNFPIKTYGGTKSFVISDSSFLGGRNVGLGVCYLIVGGFALIAMLVFLVKHVFTKKQLDQSFLDSRGSEPGTTVASPITETRRDVL